MRRLSFTLALQSRLNMKKLITFVILGVVIVTIAVFFRAGISSGVIWNLSDGGKLLFPLVAASAIVDSINPCAFSILLLTVAVLFSLGKLRSDVLKIGGFYIAGIFSAYFLIGLGLIHALHIFDTPHFMAKVGAGLLILIGLINIIGQLFPSFPVKLKIPHAVHHKMARLMEKANLPAIFLLGVLVGLCEFPCTGGPYLAVIGLLHDQATYLNGVSYLLFYNLIFILPLVILLFIVGNEKVLEKVKSWQMRESKAMRFGSGIVMIALGVLIYFL